MSDCLGCQQGGQCYQLPPDPKSLVRLCGVFFGLLWNFTIHPALDKIHYQSNNQKNFSFPFNPKIEFSGHVMSYFDFSTILYCDMQ